MEARDLSIHSQRGETAGGEVYFWDESGFRADTVHGKTWGKKGETPVIARPGQRQSISAASAVNAKGAFWYSTYQGPRHSTLRDAAQEDDAQSEQARASGGGWIACPQN